MISRGVGRSAVAASAYLSCSRMLNDYDGVRHDYTRKQGLVWRAVFLPDMAPAEWQDRKKLWNAVEEAEKTKDSRLAREFVAALPIELSRHQQIELLQNFICEQFVAEGMCADVAIHDTDGHNPHAHILLTVRPLNENGTWQYKTEKEYLCVKDGNERGFTAAEFKSAQAEGWEKQYPYKVGKKKVYMAPSAAQAHGYVRSGKHPKSTRYGRQNPISARWNSEEQLLAWREVRATAANRCLELAGHAERIDHRSHAARGLEERPTIHEGVAAQALERRGIISDRCELNRQIKADNALLRELKFAVQKLTQTVKNTIPALAEAMEKLRGNMLIFRYQLRYIGIGRKKMTDYMEAVRPILERYTKVIQEIKGKGKARKCLFTEKKETPLYNIPKMRDLTRRIAELTEDLEELKSEKQALLVSLDCPDDAAIAIMQKKVAAMEGTLVKIEVQEARYTAEFDETLKRYAELKEQAAGLDASELMDARLAVREEKERSAIDRVKNAYGEKYDPMMMHGSRRDVTKLLGEETEVWSVREHLQKRRVQKVECKNIPKKNGQER